MYYYSFISVQFRSVAQSCPTLCDSTGLAHCSLWSRKESDMTEHLT